MANSLERIIFAYVNSSRFDRTEHYLQCEWEAVFCYLRTQFLSTEVVPLEYGSLGGPDRLLIRTLEKPTNAIIFWCAPHEASANLRAAQMVREVCPETAIFVWGDAPLWMPQYFQRPPFDFIVISGDAERVLHDALMEYSQGTPPKHGMIYRENSHYKKTSAGLLQPPEEWALPWTRVLEWSSYDLVRSSRGKPGRDLSFMVSRGCGLNCGSCVDPIKTGNRDRRLPIARLLTYLKQHIADDVTFQLHSPNFGAAPRWCCEFVEAMHWENLRVPFKFVTLVKHITDPAFIEPLAEVGMVGCGVGVETLTAFSQHPLQHKAHEQDVVLAAEVAQRFGIQLTAYIQLGLPGQKREDIEYTISRLRELGYHLRPTGHTPFSRLRHLSVDQLDQLDLYEWDRKSFWTPSCDLTRGEFLRLVASPDSFEFDLARGFQEVMG